MSNKLTTFARVRALTDWRAHVFSAALLARMTPNYRLFCELTEFGEAPALLDNVLDLIWQSIASPKTRVNFGVQLEKVEEATPDVSDFDAYGVYPAIDAAIATASTLNLLMKQDPQGAVVVSKLSQGSVEAYLLSSGQATDEDVKQHPLMVFEVEVQQALLDCVEQAVYPAKAVEEAKAIALEEGITNIGVEL